MGRALSSGLATVLTTVKALALILDRLLFRPDISPSWHRSRERYALPLVAAVSRWLLLLLSPLLSATGPVPLSQVSPASWTVRCPAQTRDTQIHPVGIESYQAIQ